ncbi:MAG: hypothetical protein FWD57_06530 [Polyangiaceae bacterium]|nr:hypothetical protein [Polyangiaceae bacterium]
MPSPHPAQFHIRVNVALQIALAVLHLLLAIGAALAAVLFYFGDAGWGPLAADAVDGDKRVGNLITIVAVATWSVVGLVWTPLNAYGLGSRRPWAQASTSAYWFLSCATGVLLPFSIYGLLSLGRADVREALDSDETR